MLRITVLLTIVIAAALSSIGAPQVKTNRKVVCKTPNVAAKCYWTHGRLSLYNGNPSYRLWRVGTHRILGIYSGPGFEKRYQLDSENPELPRNVERAFKTPYSQIFADFEVCPLEPEVARTMQSACIESAKNIVVEK
jgi:hypothetical protein